MGRIHSSTCQVAIFADSNFVCEDINERDLRIDYYRASGAGGQHVNKTESAVRITHIPSGIVVQNQDERDQHRNKAKAMETLKNRLYNKNLSEYKSEINDSRRSQHGSGNLSEKIRTYNWPDSRVTDHRIGVTLYGIDSMLEGDNLETILNKLIEKEKLKKLNNVLNKLNEEN
jgi:peptide chain release factor 1